MSNKEQKQPKQEPKKPTHPTPKPIKQNNPNIGKGVGVPQRRNLDVD